MDLYKYLFKPSKTDTYDIGRRHIQLDNIETRSVFEPDDNFVNKCIEEALTKHSIDYQQSHGKYCHDFTEGNAHIGIYTEATVKEFQRLNDIIDKSYGDDEDDVTWKSEDGQVFRNKAYDDYNSFGEIVANDESYWKDKMVFSDIPIVTTYKVIGSHEETNYARKPFREINDKNVEAYRLIIANCKGDPEGAFVIFDRESEYDFKQLIRMIESEDMVDHLNSMLPIAADELICIDW